MQTQITARHFEAQPSLKDYASARLSKLQRYYDGITDAHVILTSKKTIPTDKHADVTIGVYRQRLAAQHAGTTFEEAIDQCVESLRRQLIRYKAKLRSKEKTVHH